MLLEGWVSFGIIWFLAILGIFYKIFWWLQYPRLSIILYLILGWSILFFIEPVRHSLTTLSLLLIIAEGIIYTFGIYFFINDRTHRYYHGIWHIFVILGTLCHWAAVFVMAWPWENGLWANQPSLVISITSFYNRQSDIRSRISFAMNIDCGLLKNALITGIDVAERLRIAVDKREPT